MDKINVTIRNIDPAVWQRFRSLAVAEKMTVGEKLNAVMAATCGDSVDDPGLFAKTYMRKHKAATWGQYRKAVYEHLNPEDPLSLSAKWDVPVEYIDAFKRVCGR